mmetsp:Transcript_27699/g.52484  ORF Transcript_27699/g.52484 Transcript_27699/m.52484 type:complete len:711 (-) Transcript_27699:189-2321(-)
MVKHLIMPSQMSNSAIPPYTPNLSLNFDALFPLYLCITFFGLFCMFAGLRCMIDGSDDLIAHSPDGSLSTFSWVWGFLSGFCRVNPASACMLSTCLISLSLWSKHRAMSMSSGASSRDLKAMLHKSKSTTSIEIPTGIDSSMGSGKAQTRSSASSSNLPQIAEPKHKNEWMPQKSRAFRDHWYYSLPKVCFLNALIVTSIVLLYGMLCSIFPAWHWHFSAIFFYNVPKLNNVVKATEGICPSYGGDMCLSNDAWLILSNGLLSKYKRDDVEAVANGVNVAQNGGLIINIMARDTIDAVPALIKNIDSLSPFFKGKLAVVLYENDSIDGTREAFKAWQATATGYKVDLMTCEDQGDVDCKLKQIHRYDQSGEFISAVGRMADYRNLVQAYITKNYKPKEYSHMMVTDIDLAVSLAPLGLMHAMGTIGEHAPVAARGLMMIPGAMGTLYSPYDYSAFRPVINDDNRYLRSWHDWFCELAPAGSRWRNNCDVMSPFNMLHVLAMDTEYVSAPYPVVSAFHGATLYPFKQIVETSPLYDDGDDHQRCEHIGFNMALTDETRWEKNADTANYATQMYISPKWTLHLDPTRPGGPTGWRFFSLVMTQGLNSQCLVMFSIVCFWNFVISAGAALTILGMLRLWEKCIRTSLFKKWAVVAGVNVADVIPGGLGGTVRKNTADDEGILLLALAASNDCDSDDDEEMGIPLRRDAGAKNL